MYNVRFAAFLVNDAHPTVVTSVGHTLVNRWFNQNGYLLPGFIDPEDSAESDLASLPRSLAKKGPRP